MAGYVKSALKELEHVLPKSFFCSPSPYQEPKFGQKVQYSNIDTTPLLQPSAIKYIQRVTGKFLFYARAIDNTMLHALNNIATATINGTEATLAATKNFLNYATSNPDAEIKYTASDMILQVHSDAAFDVASESQSRAGGYHFLGNKNLTKFNATILVIAKIIQGVMASAAEAEVGSLFINAQEAIPIRQFL